MQSFIYIQCTLQFSYTHLGLSPNRCEVNAQKNNIKFDAFFMLSVVVVVVVLEALKLISFCMSLCMSLCIHTAFSVQCSITSLIFMLVLVVYFVGFSVDDSSVRCWCFFSAFHVLGTTTPSTIDWHVQTAQIFACTHVNKKLTQRTYKSIERPQVLYVCVCV